MSENATPDVSIGALMYAITYSRISEARPMKILGEVVHAVDGRRTTGQSIGMGEVELEPFADVFEHGERDVAKKLI